MPSISIPDDLCCMITDNGSYRPESTMSLRKLARSVGERVGHPVAPVSLLHSTKIDPAELDGEPARIFEPFLKAQLDAGTNRFLVLPMFFGPSAAITEYLPQRVMALKESHPGLEVRVAPCVVDRRQTGDTAMASILLDLVIRKAEEEKLSRPSIAVVDHGTPRQPVTEVRNLLASQMEALVKEHHGDRFGAVRPCSMERRDGAEYDFNEPLLERLLGTREFENDVVVSMLFASPGRHAGPGGDVAKICEDARAKCPSLRTFMTSLVAAHAGLVDLLVDRFYQGVQSDPIEGELVM